MSLYETDVRGLTLLFLDFQFHIPSKNELSVKIIAHFSMGILSLQTPGWLKQRLRGLNFTSGQQY